MEDFGGYGNYKKWWDALSSEWRHMFLFNYQIKMEKDDLPKMFESHNGFVHFFSEEYNMYEYFSNEPGTLNELKTICEFSINCEEFLPIGVNYIRIKDSCIINFKTNVKQLYDLTFLRNLKSLEIVDDDGIDGFNFNFFKLFPRLEKICLPINYFDKVSDIALLRLNSLSEISFYLDTDINLYGYEDERELKINSLSPYFGKQITINKQYYKDCYIDIQTLQLKMLV